jgi:hypothetical protein
MPILRYHAVTFYSQLDEKLFFEGLGAIAAVSKIEGEGSDILVHVQSRPSATALRDLLAISFRYGVDMKQLAQFVTPQNRGWFRRRGMYWSRLVFGRTETRNKSVETTRGNQS